MKKELSKKISLMLCGALFLSNLVGSSFAHANPTKSTDSSDASMAAGEETTDKSTSEEAAGEKATGMSTSEKAASEGRNGRTMQYFYRPSHESFDPLGRGKFPTGGLVSVDWLTKKQETWSEIVKSLMKLYKAMCRKFGFYSAVCPENCIDELEMLLKTIKMDSRKLELHVTDLSGSAQYPFWDFAKFLEKLIENRKVCKEEYGGILDLNLYQVIEAINILFDKYKLNPMYKTAIVFDPSLF